MKLCEPHYIVQSTETGEFLKPHDGHLSMAKMFDEAGSFDDLQDAFETAESYLDAFEIHTVYLPKEDI